MDVVSGLRDLTLVAVAIALPMMPVFPISDAPYDVSSRMQGGLDWVALASSPQPQGTVGAMASAARAACENPFANLPEDQQPQNWPFNDCDETPSLLSLLPTPSQVPVGYLLRTENEQDRRDVIDALGGSEQTARMLKSWGWQASATREFIADQEADQTAPSGYLGATVYQLGDATAAAAALNEVPSMVSFGESLREVTSPAFGQHARLFEGDGDGVQLAALYVQDGLYLYRLAATGTGDEADPKRAVLETAEELFNQSSEPTQQEQLAQAAATIAAYATQEVERAEQLAFAAGTATAVAGTHAAESAKAETETANAAATVTAYATRVTRNETTLDQNEQQAARLAALATQEAIEAHATIAVLEARDAARATTIAESESEAATAQGTVAPLQTAQADIAAQASVIASQATAIGALTDQATVVSAQATRIAQLASQQIDAQVTATALAVVAANSVLDPTRQSIVIQTDLDGMLAGEDAALTDARRSLETALSRYPLGSCRAGFILISGKAPDIDQGISLAERISALLRSSFLEIFSDSTGEELFALPNDQPFGEVGIDIFFYSGCQPIG